MELNFTGKRAIVTGAGAGLGKDIALTLSSAGATVYGLSLLQTELDALKIECPGIQTTCVDVSDWKACESAISTIGPVDMLVNCAGVVNTRPFLDTTEDIYNKVFDVNVKGTLVATRAVAEFMVAHKIKGSIVNLSGIAASRSVGIFIYSASKSAVEQMTRCMAAELGPHQIRVNAVAPTLVPATLMGQKFVAELGPESGRMVAERAVLKRNADIHHITSAVMYLLSDAAAMVTGTILPVDGGYLCT